MDSDQIVFAEVKSVIGKTGKCHGQRRSHFFPFLFFSALIYDFLGVKLRKMI